MIERIFFMRFPPCHWVRLLGYCILIPDLAIKERSIMSFRQKLQWTGAMLIVSSFLASTGLTYASLRLERTSSGWLQFTVRPEEMEDIVSFVVFLIIALGALLLLAGTVLPRMQGEHRNDTQLSMPRMIVSLGWIGLLQLVLSMVVPAVESLLPEMAARTMDTTFYPVLLQISGILVIPAFYRNRWRAIGLGRGRTTWRTWRLVLVLAVISYAISVGSDVVSQWIHLEPVSYREKLISHDLHSAARLGPFSAFLGWFATGFLAPVGEELIFRGVIQSTLSARWGPGWGLWLSSFFFAFVHADPSLFLPIFLLGVVFGYAYKRSGSLWAPMVLHILNNTAATLSDLGI
jgi:membrane protease YdiL (CAAX protease family)